MCCFVEQDISIGVEDNSKKHTVGMTSALVLYVH